MCYYCQWDGETMVLSEFDPFIGDEMAALMRNNAQLDK
jgi:hypothetical protein